MEITVIGAGALGKIWLHYFALKDHFIHSWIKDKNASQISYTICDLGKIQTEVTCKANDLVELQKAEIVLLTLKAFSIVSALQESLPFIKKNTPIIVLHNGMGISEKISALFPDRQHQIYYGITTQAAYIEGKTVIHAASGITHIGQLPVINNGKYSSHPLDSNLLKTLNKSLPHVKWTDNIKSQQWHKLAINALINPLTVKYQCKNGELLNYRAEIEGLALELTLLFEKLTRVGELFSDERVDLFENALDVIEKTSNNYSSMYQDYVGERPTEIDYITGYILRVAEQLNINMPLHNALYQCVNQKVLTISE
ncbi:ketopantoate reductase family protein [Thorsellia anophelis]|uniref:2-dehydropantoate 2-reductase n=1 Tax=Thorsellia anophelis DSM 18579 TaxID=1123402 RepID=A0A1I0ANJ4_9GAMM|nr:2-dehydropantoate 2-reductase [Thorsellia anophelis]SES95929.1 2-dehydropantoate 2-reductase [Thorsellia anophelis DSM 18579]